MICYLPNLRLYWFCNPGSSVVSFIIFCQIPCLVNVGMENILDAPFHYFSLLFFSLFSTWIRDFLCGQSGYFSSGHVVGNFPRYEAFVLGGTNSFLGMNI
ncbi:hypothetical protein R3W88_016399 [Solanum pinnatisectum]|uniref:Uncharacterized protein n=1 Tax=Solanum pinnatisectum TaxID=50273 RepID=A0AAV9KX94_9SOLN|nr:hypothetical protein R3W88_016399 [Solanum pinnatisectum]